MLKVDLFRLEELKREGSLVEYVCRSPDKTPLLVPAGHHIGCNTWESFLSVEPIVWRVLPATFDRTIGWLERRHPHKNLGATVQTHRARSRKQAPPMPSPTDRNLTALPSKAVNPPRRDRTAVHRGAPSDARLVERVHDHLALYRTPVHLAHTRSTSAKHRIRHEIRHTAALAGRRPRQSVANGRLRHMLIGYAHVSKADGSQSLDLQRDALQAATTAAGSSRCRKPRCGWPRPQWPTVTRPCPHSALNSGSPPWPASACCIRSSHLDQDVAELGVDASFELVFMPERDEES